MDGSTAQARRYYHHVANGGTLNEWDVARMVEAMEAKDAEITRLTAALAEAEARSAALVAEARAEGMREAAGIADGHAAPLRGKASKCRDRGDDLGEAVFDSALSEANSIATAIRALAQKEAGE